MNFQYSSRSVLRMRMCMRMCITVCVVSRMCMFFLCMRLTKEFGTQMKNTHTGLIRIRIRIRIYAYAISEKYAADTVCSTYIYIVFIQNTLYLKKRNYKMLF